MKLLKNCIIQIVLYLTCFSFMIRLNNGYFTFYNIIFDNKIFEYDNSEKVIFGIILLGSLLYSIFNSRAIKTSVQFITYLFIFAGIQHKFTTNIMRIDSSLLYYIGLMFLVTSSSTFELLSEIKNSEYMIYEVENLIILKLIIDFTLCFFISYKLCNTLIDFMTIPILGMIWMVIIIKNEYVLLTSFESYIFMQKVIMLTPIFIFSEVYLK